MYLKYMAIQHGLNSIKYLNTEEIILSIIIAVVLSIIIIKLLG